MCVCVFCVYTTSQHLEKIKFACLSLLRVMNVIPFPFFASFAIIFALCVMLSYQIHNAKSKEQGKLTTRTCITHNKKSKEIFAVLRHCLILQEESAR
jgi:hypothetical protein